MAFEKIILDFARIFAMNAHVVHSKFCPLESQNIESGRGSTILLRIPFR